MPGGKSVFSDLWLDKKEFADWLMHDDNKYSAACKVCKKTFDISNMGETAVKSHAKGVKHIALLQQRHQSCRTSNSSYFSKSTKSIKHTITSAESANNEKTSESDSACSSALAPSSIASEIHPWPAPGQFFTRSDVLKAEVIWTLKVVTSHFSFSSCQDIQNTFSLMFPDSDIVKRFTCGEKKCAYLCTYGITPHFHHLLSKSVSEQDSYVLLFDSTKL